MPEQQAVLSGGQNKLSSQAQQDWDALKQDCNLCQQHGADICVLFRLVRYHAVTYNPDVSETTPALSRICEKAQSATAAKSIANKLLLMQASATFSFLQDVWKQQNETNALYNNLSTLNVSIIVAWELMIATTNQDISWKYDVLEKITALNLNLDPKDANALEYALTWRPFYTAEELEKEFHKKKDWITTFKGLPAYIGTDESEILSLGYTIQYDNSIGGRFGIILKKGNSQKARVYRIFLGSEIYLDEAYVAEDSKYIGVIDTQKEIVKGKGIPTVLYLTILMMNKQNVNMSGISKIFIDEITNEETSLEMAFLDKKYKNTISTENKFEHTSTFYYAKSMMEQIGKSHIIIQSISYSMLEECCTGDESKKYRLRDGDDIFTLYRAYFNVQ